METTATDGSGLSAPADFRGTWRSDDEARAVYSEAAGIARVIPRAVAVPADTDDVVTLVKWAASERVPLVPRGSGSSMAGGAIGEGVVLDLSRLRGRAGVNAESLGYRAEAGVLRGEIDSEARAQGLRFPVDPSSGAFCTIGGMVATNASGARSLKYGSTRPWVQALDCVFADGTRAEVRRGDPLIVGAATVIPSAARDLLVSSTDATGASSSLRHVRKNSSGYHPWKGDVLDLLVGSEGTLAIFVGVEVGLIPVAPATTTILAAFPSLDAAAAAAAIAREAGASACELLDRTFVDIARAGNAPAATAIPSGSEAVLLVEIEGGDGDEALASATALARRFDETGASVTAVSLSAGDEQQLWSLRHAASPILARLDPSLKSMQFIEDGAVPPEHLTDYILGVRAALERQKVRGVIFGHAGDAHIHVNPLVDVGAPDWRERVEALFADVCELTVKLGGTMSGEHGDGSLRAPVVGDILGDSAAEWGFALKRAFDPQGILNPGVKVPLPGQRAIERVKYDPSLPALPSAATRALDDVAARRAYAEFRLDLLDAAQLLPRPQSHVARSDPAD
jgi:FAD/FMN-containing dehydrogenase